MSRHHQPGNRQAKAAWLARTNRLCALRLAGCTTYADTVDDVVPLSAGGVDNPANWRPACRACNSRRGARPTAGLPSVADATAQRTRVGLLMGAADPPSEGIPPGGTPRNAVREAPPTPRPNPSRGVRGSGGGWMGPRRSDSDSYTVR